MRLQKVVVCLAVFLFLITGSQLFAQAVGSIVGVVADPTGANVPDANVTVNNAQKGISRTVQTNASGEYVVPALQPGVYDVTVEKEGFKKTVKQATVEVGSNVTVDIALQVGETSQSVSVEAEAMAVNTTDASVAQIVSPADVTDIPLNGRNAYELAKLVPGTTVVAKSGRNSDMSVTVAGSQSVRFMIDGADATDYIYAGIGLNSEYNLSADVVQEFQVATNNGDPSNGVGQGGTINMITKSGGDAFHGSAWGYFRNNQYAGYPGLTVPALLPNPTNNPTVTAFNNAEEHPGFYRYQYGTAVGGPLFSPDKHVYWFASFENSPSISVVSFAGGAPFNAFNELTQIPHNRRDQNYRVDWHPTDKNSLFWRVTTDRENGEINPAGLASTAFTTENKGIMYLVGWTWIPTATIVNDFRIGYDKLEYNETENPEAYAEATQYEPSLLNQSSPPGFGPPLTYAGNTVVDGSNLSFGASTSGNDTEDMPRGQIDDNLTWTRGSHTFKFGGTVARTPWYFNWYSQTPFYATVFSPTQAAAAGISIPATFNTLADVLQLPVNTFGMGVGHANVVGDQFQGDNIHVLHEYHFYGADIYRISRKLTVNYSLGWDYFGNGTDWDLPKPAILSKVFNGDLGPTPNYKKAIAPAFGFSWDPTAHGSTVIRGGAGMFYGLLPPYAMFTERGLISPFGDGYVSVPGTFIQNPIAGDIGALNFPTIGSNITAAGANGAVRLADLIPYVAGLRSTFDNQFTNTNTNLAMTNLNYFGGTSAAGGSTSGNLLSPNLRPPVSYQNTLGFQHQFGQDWLVSVAGVVNIMNHLSYKEDLNRFQRPATQCAGCAPGVDGGRVDTNLAYAVTQTSGTNGIYKALNVNVTKRMSHRWTMTAAYTFSRMRDAVGSGGGLGGLLFDYTTRANNYGPDASTDQTHTLVVNGTMQLPLGFEFALVSDIASPLPLNAYLNGIDLRGDGTTNDLLPGISYNSLNRGTSAAQLRAAVASFNAKYAGTLDSSGDHIGMVNLPATFRFGKTFIDQDIRVAKTFNFWQERLHVQFATEVFNVFNYGNLLFPASAGNLYSPAFGQPSQRVASTLGSGGPRALQFFVRGTF